MQLQAIRLNLEQQKGKRQQLEDDLKRYEKTKAEYETEEKEWEQVQVIFQTVVQQTQQTLRYRIGEVCTLALESIFDDPYSLDIDFVTKRGKVEAEIFFQRDEMKFTDPLNEIGGGSCDSGSIGLIFSMWSLRVPRTRALMLFDEPFRNLDRYEELKRAARASKMIKQVSSKMQMQVIMVTHNDFLIEAADKVIELAKRN